MSEPTENEKEYTSADIQIISVEEAIRIKAAMYVDSTDIRGLHNLILEHIKIRTTIDHFVVAKSFEVTLNADNSFTLKVDENLLCLPEFATKLRHPRGDITNFEAGMTRLYTPGGVTFQSVIPNALSEWAWAKIIDRKNKVVYRQEYKRGVAQTGIIQTADPVELEEFGEEWSDIYCFKPDPEIFQTTEFNYPALYTAFCRVAQLDSSLKLRLIDQRNDHPYQDNTFAFRNGALNLLEELILENVFVTHWRESSPLSNPLFCVKETFEEFHIEIALEFTPGLFSCCLCYFNGRSQPKPYKGLWEGLEEAIGSYAIRENLLSPDSSKFTLKELQKGLIAVVNVKTETSRWLRVSENIESYEPKVKTALKKVLSKVFREWLEAHPAEAKRLVEGLLEARKKK